MITLEGLGKRTDVLENALSFFVVQTGAALLRLEKGIEEMREQATAVRQADMQRWERWEREQQNYLQKREEERQVDVQRFAEWQRQMEAWQQQMETWQQRTEAWKQETDAWQRQRDEEFRKDQQAYNKRWGDLANKLGTIVEDMVAPNIPRLARQHFDCGEPQDFMVRRWVRHKQDPTKRREFDVIAVYDHLVIINETKSSARIDYIDDFIQMLPELTSYFPEYQGKQIIPVFASLYLGEDMVNYLTKHNIYAMAMGEETMDLLNVEKVTPPTGSLHRLTAGSYQCY